MTINKAQIDAALAQVVDSAKNVDKVVIEAGRVAVDIVLSYPAKSQFEAWRTRVASALAALPGVKTVEVTVSQRIVAHAVQRGLQLIPEVRNIIAIASAKGGVGKSTTAVNLALALHAEGANVGLLDADIYGPSQPIMLGIVGRPESKDAKTMEPLEGHGLQVNSIGFLVESDQPMIWRGPMVTSALNQLLRQTNWRDLDYLIVDLPPGTGDIQLTLAQRVPVTGAVMVTTPQEIALIDAKKGLRMFEKMGVSILGLVENMSVHICSNCGHTQPIFGAGGSEKMCAQYGIELLGNLPLEMSIREQTDAGRPTVVADPTSRTAHLYHEIARKVALRIAEKTCDMSSKFPKIVVQNR